MTTPTDLPARVEEALHFRDYFSEARHESLFAALSPEPKT